MSQLNPLAGNFQFQPNNLPQSITLNASQFRQLQQSMSDPGNYAPAGIQPIFNLAPTCSFAPHGQSQPFRFAPRYSTVGQQLQPEFNIPLQNYFGPLATPNV